MQRNNPPNIPGYTPNPHDYSKVLSNGSQTVGLCEIQGKRPEQEDQVIVEFNAAALLKNTKDADIVKAYNTTIADIHNQTAGITGQGSTCVSTTAWIDPATNKINVCTANVGDSEAMLVIVRANGTVESRRLNALHNAQNAKEVTRVQDEGGRIFNGRLAGQLAVTRGIGDRGFDGGGISHQPEVTFDRNSALGQGDVAFVVMGCDGLTDDNRPNGDHAKKNSAAAIGEIVKANKGQPPEVIANALVSQAYGGNGSTDNISAAVFRVSTTPTSVAVCDGHGGPAVSALIANKLYSGLKQELEKGARIQAAPPVNQSTPSPNDPKPLPNDPGVLLNNLLQKKFEFHRAGPNIPYNSYIVGAAGEKDALHLQNELQKAGIISKIKFKEIMGEKLFMVVVAEGQAQAHALYRHARAQADPAVQFKEMQAAAKAGNAKADLMLGRMCEAGVGTTKDLLAARNHYNTAIQRIDAKEDLKGVNEKLKSYDLLGELLPSDKRNFMQLDSKKNILFISFKDKATCDIAKQLLGCSLTEKHTDGLLPLPLTEELRRKLVDPQIFQQLKASLNPAPAVSDVQAPVESKPQGNMDRAPSYLNPILLDQVQKSVEKSWKVEKAPSPANKQIFHVIDNKGTPRFEIHPNRLSTSQDNRDTFVAMLKAFQQMHGTKLPRVTCGEKTKELWVSAFKEVYKGQEAKVDAVIQVTAAAVQQSSPSPPPPKKPEAPAPIKEPERRPRM